MGQLPRNQVITHQPTVTLYKGQAATTSLDVAALFGKQHLHVLRSIRGILETAPGRFTESNFGFSDYLDPTGRSLPMYHLTRDGFSLLAMGFTGPEAMRWKIAYIEAFNQMEAALRNNDWDRAQRMEETLFVDHPQWKAIRELLDLGYPMDYVLRQTGYKSPATIHRHAREMARFGLLERVIPHPCLGRKRPEWHIPRRARWGGVPVLEFKPSPRRAAA